MNMDKSVTSRGRLEVSEFVFMAHHILSLPCWFCYESLLVVSEAICNYLSLHLGVTSQNSPDLESSFPPPNNFMKGLILQEF